MQIQALLTASAMNLKQLVRRRPEAQTGRALVVGQRSIPCSDGPLARCWLRPCKSLGATRSPEARAAFSMRSGPFFRPFGNINES